VRSNRLLSAPIRILKRYKYIFVDISLEVGYVEQSYHRAASCFLLKMLRSIASEHRNRFLFSYYFECGRISITRCADPDRNKNRFQTFLLGFLSFFFFLLFLFTPLKRSRRTQVNPEMKEKFEKSGRGRYGRQTFVQRT